MPDVAVKIETVEVDKGYKKLLDTLSNDVAGSFVEIGIFGGASPKAASVLQYALANEFGVTIVTNEGVIITIPERSWFRSTINQNNKIYQDDIEIGLTVIGLGKDTAAGVLTRLGIKIRNNLQTKIRDLKSPANADSTIKSKGSSNPLVDTRAMTRHVTYELGKVFKPGPRIKL